MTDIIKRLKTSKKHLFVGLAGPGTGKSHTFKTIIDSKEFKGKKVLILSFINKLVDELTRDFQDYENVQVSTLHSFALTQYKSLVPDVEISLDPDLDDLISEDELFINSQKINYKERLHNGDLNSDEERFYKERSEFYGNSSKLYSFNSIIYAVNRLFRENGDKIPYGYDLVLLDELQDFNLLEYDLVSFLNMKNKIVVVGDDDQSLYDWKNAKPDLIRDLYNHEDSETFTLDYCYRCPEVVIKAVNSLFENTTKFSLLNNRVKKQFLCPSSLNAAKVEINKKYNKIDFLSGFKGSQLIYQLSESMKKDINGERNNRILIIAPSYLKQSLYEGLIKKGFHAVEFELFSNEEHNKIKHKKIVEAFSALIKRKTDNLALRKILRLYLNNGELKALILRSYADKKNLRNSLNDEEIKQKIESDIAMFKKSKSGKSMLSDSEVLRISRIFSIKNLISKMIKGFDHIKKDSIEFEMTTAMSSKGLSADFVYYLGIDDKDMLDRKTNKLTDQKVSEFLVGITRAKKKLTLIALENRNPKILELIDGRYINLREK